MNHGSKHSKIVNSFTIINGRFQSEKEYPYTFHSYDKGKTIQLILVLPGTIPESFRLYADHDHIRIRVHVQKFCFKLYQGEIIQLEGKIPVPVIPGIITTRVEYGVYFVELAKA